MVAVLYQVYILYLYPQLRIGGFCFTAHMVLLTAANILRLRIRC